MRNSWKISKSRTLPKKVNNYNLGQKLFEINSSSFYVGTNTYINEKVLIRIYSKLNLNKDLEEITNINNEVFLLKILNHKNVLRLYEIIESVDFIFLIYEYFDGELLSDVVKTRKFDEKEILTILYGMSTALTYLHHTMRTAHLTLNLDSIIIDKNLNVKITNFRYSRLYSKDINNFKERKDMFLYSCPEIHAKQKYNPEYADVYSCGIIVYYLYMGELPFNSNRKILTDQLIMQGEYTLPESITERMFDVITTLMKNEPKQRKRFKEIVSSNWFNDIELRSKDQREIRGLNIFHERYPIDELVMKICNEYKLNKKDIFVHLNSNAFNNITSLYKQIENKLNRKGIKTMCDLHSDKFIVYLNNNLNYYESKENKNNHEKFRKEHNTNAEEIKNKITKLQENQIVVYEGLENQRQRYINHDYEDEEKEEMPRLSKRGRSIHYGKKLIDSIKNNNNLNIVSNNDPKTFITKNEISVGYTMNSKKEPPKKDKRKMYKKSQSMRFDEDENDKDNKTKGILKNKVKNKRIGQSIILDRNSLMKEKSKRRSSLLKNNIKNFEEYIVNFYQKDNSKKIDEKDEDNKSMYSDKSSKSNKSNKSNKTNKTTKSNKTSKTFKTKKSVKINDKDLKKENENSIKEKEKEKENKKRISVKKEKDVKENIVPKRKSVKKEKDVKINVEPKRKSLKKEKEDKVNTKNLVENKSEIINIKTIEPKKNDENNDMMKSKSIKVINENNKEVKPIKKETSNNQNLVKKQNKKVKAEANNKPLEIKEENIKKKEENNQKNTKKETNKNELKENKKEVSFKNIKENKNELKQNNDKEKEKEKERELTKSYNDLFVNLNSNKKRNIIDSNKTQKLLTLKNLNLKERQIKTIESKPNIKNIKIKEKKAKIRKFYGLENRKDMNSNLTSRNKQKKQKYNFDDIPPLDEYKLYLNALFNEKTSNIENFNATMNNYNKGSPLSKPLSKYNLNKSKNNINHNNNYTVDNNITDSNFFDDPNSKRSKRSKNKKFSKEKYVNSFMNTISNTDTHSKTDKISPNSHINLKKNKLKSKNSEKNRKNYLTLESMSINENEKELDDEKNNKIQKQKKSHKRIKSCDDEENVYNKKQLMEIKNTLNKEFYSGQIKSTKKFNPLNNNNSISARKIRIISKEKLSTSKLGKNNGLTISTIPKSKNNNIINQIYVNDKLKNNINSFNINLENAKNKLKDKLISVTNELRAEKLRYYTGPINIGCISSKKIDESLSKFINKLKMNGYKYVKIKDYLFKCSKGDTSFIVELVKIKGNLLYYLVKNE